MYLVGLYLVIGIFTGLLTGILGGGTGPILIPILTALLIYQDFPSELVMRLAVGTALGIAVIAMLASMHTQRKYMSEVKGIVAQLLPGGIIGSVIGVLLAGYLSDYMFKFLFGFVVIGIALYMIFDYRFNGTKSALPSKKKFFLLSIPMGIIATCFGVGMGPICVPLLKKFGFIISTSIAVATFVGGIIVLFAALGFVIMGYHQASLPTYSLGYIYLPILAWIGIPSILFARIGAKLSHIFPPEALKTLFTVFLLLIGLKMIF
ncbi:MAG: sulfite exporter TauE/SafE family protein [Tatlockia sp.]|nr:sulfite exporter TauE/SafE family protein [Tatlockia sp.]MBA3978038.1 sulfite exporter TauE/SafE family protein [Nitrosopumilus sp.]